MGNQIPILTIIFLNFLIFLNCAQCENTTTENGVRKIFASKFFQIQLPFDPSQASSISRKCHEDSKFFIDSLRKLDFWALQMHDATAKLSSGVLNGNINQFGDYDQCLNLEIPSDLEFQGKYCLANLQSREIKSNAYLEKLRKFTQAHEAFTSEFEDATHIVPGFSSINWGLCIPSSCSSEDVEKTLDEYVSNFTEHLGIYFRVKVDESNCNIKTDLTSKFNRGTILAISFFLMIFIVSALSTYYEVYHKTSDSSDWLTVFSLKKNFEQMISTSREASDIKTAHGIRFLNVIILVSSHRCMTSFFYGYSNRAQMNLDFTSPWTAIARTCVLCTDTFVLLSGMLTAYSFFGKLKRNQSINLFQEYAGRYVRILPPLLAVMIFMTYILPLMGEGPQWNHLIDFQVDLCKNYWWRNFLFIQNFFGFENICVTHSHYVCVDTQLFLIAPLLVYTIWKWPRKGTVFVLSVATVSTLARFYVTYSSSLTDYLYFGMSAKDIYGISNIIYIKPHFRITPYILGIFLGYILRMRRNILSELLTEKQIKLGWYMSFVLMLVTMFGNFNMTFADYKYSPLQGSIFAAFAPVMWSWINIWIILASESGYKNQLVKFLEWKGFLVSTSISYSIYLTQFMVFYYNIGVSRGVENFSFLRMVFGLGEIVMVILTSVILTLFVDLPFGNIKKILFKSAAVKKKEPETSVFTKKID